VISAAAGIHVELWRLLSSMWHASDDCLLPLPLLIVFAAAGIHVELWRLLSGNVACIQ
jgi:hypothetical protein